MENPTTVVQYNATGGVTTGSNGHDPLSLSNVVIKTEPSDSKNLWSVQPNIDGPFADSDNSSIASGSGSGSTSGRSPVTKAAPKVTSFTLPPTPSSSDNESSLSPQPQTQMTVRLPNAASLSIANAISHSVRLTTTDHSSSAQATDA